MSTETFDISCRVNSDDCALFTEVINQSIDARLEAFTQSQFLGNSKTGSVHFNFHPDELQILIRRLDALETEDADLWVSDIIQAHYGVEVA